MHNMKSHSHTERGSITLEYIIVSSCATLLALAGISYAGKLFLNQITEMSEKTGSSIETPSLDWME